MQLLHKIKTLCRIWNYPGPTDPVQRRKKTPDNSMDDETVVPEGQLK